jgi:hypothetical protein
VTSTAGPRPLVAAGVVTVDLRSRTLTVRPAPSARPYAKVLWADGVAAQALAWPPSAARTVWASGAGKRDISYGVPAGDALEFRFPRGDPTYRKLVGPPGLRATFAVDTVSRRILSVTFRAKA